MEKVLNFFDCDGTLIATPLPDPGKDVWAAHHGKPYPHQGWWGRAESLDTDVFKMEPRDIAYTAYLEHAEALDTYNYILTSRLPKLKSYLANILSINGIVVDDILCAKGSLTKGQRIVEVLHEHEAKGEKVKVINMWEDRNKEIVTIEAQRDYFEGRGIVLNIYKIQSDATD
jgi:hypothetical protein